jgi:hypothetical protein
MLVSVISWGCEHIVGPSKMTILMPAALPGQPHFLLMQQPSEGLRVRVVNSDWFSPFRVLIDPSHWRRY